MLYPKEPEAPGMHDDRKSVPDLDYALYEKKSEAAGLQDEGQLALDDGACDKQSVGAEGQQASDDALYEKYTETAGTYDERQQASDDALVNKPPGKSPNPTHRHGDNAWFTKTRRMIAENASPCVLRPYSFFVAWNGVLTLVYSGFPPQLAKIKSKLNEAGFGLKKENFGSMWPKSTLGALKDEAPDFTLEELASLRAMCEEHATRLASLLVRVRRLSFVAYARRSLEAAETRQRSDVDLTVATTPAAEEAAPSEEETERVRGVVSQWENLAEYLPRVNAPGSRIGSYREASPAGTTLVAFLAPDGAPAELERVVADFRAAVDAKFPGRYAWMESDSLHCTIRGL